MNLPIVPSSLNPSSTSISVISIAPAEYSCCLCSKLCLPPLTLSSNNTYVPTTYLPLWNVSFSCTWSFFKFRSQVPAILRYISFLRNKIKYPYLKLSKLHIEPVDSPADLMKQPVLVTVLSSIQSTISESQQTNKNQARFKIGPTHCVKNKIILFGGDCVFGVSYNISNTVTALRMHQRQSLFNHIYYKVRLQDIIAISIRIFLMRRNN